LAKARWMMARLASNNFLETDNRSLWVLFGLEVGIAWSGSSLTIDAWRERYTCRQLLGLFFCKLIILKWVVHSHCRQVFFILFCVHKQSLSHYDILDAVVSGVLSSMNKYVFVLVSTQVCIHRFSWTLWFYDISYQVPPSQYSSSSLSFQFGSAHSYTCQLWVSGWCSICYCMVNKLWP